MSDDKTEHDAKEPADAGGSDGRKLDSMSRTSIESRLKSMYDEVASEPVPDRFLQLLDRLERTEDGDRTSHGRIAR